MTLTEVKTWTICLNSFSLSFWFLQFDSLPKLGCSRILSIVQVGLEHKDPPTSASAVLALKMFTIITGPKLFLNSFNKLKTQQLGSWLEDSTPFIPFNIMLFFNLFIFWNTELSTILLPDVPFLLKLHCFQISLTLFFRDLHENTTNNQAIQSVLGCFEVPFSKCVNP